MKMEIYERIRDMLDSSISEIFAKVRDEYDIVYTHCPPDLTRNINDAIVELAANMANVIDSQLK